MRAVSLPNVHFYPVRQVWLATAAIALTLLAAISGVVFRSNIAPLMIAVAVCMLALTVILVERPVWALYATLLVVFMPTGIMPAFWQSNLNRGITVFAFSLWLLATIAQNRRVTITGTAWLMFAFLIWATASLVWAGDLWAARTGIQVYLLRFALFLVLIPNLVRTRDQLDGLMGTLAVCGWILVVSCVAAFVSTGYSPGDRFRVFDMNENSTGVCALVSMVGILWLAMQSRHRSSAAAKLVGFLYLACALVVTAATGSRGSMLSLLLAIAVLWFWRPTRLWSLGGLIILILALALLPSTFVTLSARLAVERGDTLLGNREVLWRSGWRLVLDHPWLGVGINNAPRMMASYAGAARGVGQYEVVPIHNPVLTIWAETGIVGILIYLGVLTGAALTFVHSWLSDRRTGRTWLMPYYALVAAVSLGYFASWIKGGGIESDRTYFLILALLVLPSHLINEGASAESTGDGSGGTCDSVEGSRPWRTP